MNDHTIWVSSKWSYDELNEKSVYFDISEPFDPVADGIGDFAIRESPDGLLAITILVFDPTKIHRFPLCQPLADRIEIHPDQNVSRFRLISSG
jgi:hypothetical protein